MNAESHAPAGSSSLSRGYLICLTATVLWSFTGIFIRYLTENFGIPALVLAFWRDTFVALALLGAFSLFKSGLLRTESHHLRFLLGYGFILAIFNAVWTASVALNGAAISTVLVYSSTAFTTLLGWRLFAERLTLTKVLIVLICLSGCVLVAGAYDPALWQINPIGITTGLVSGLLFASYILMGKASANRGIQAWTALLHSFGYAALFLLGFNLISALWQGENPIANFLWLDGSVVGWGVLILLAVGPTIGGFGLYTVSLGILPASVANLIATLEPALTAILAYLLLGETLSPPQLAGSFMILAGVVVLRLYEK